MQADNSTISFGETANKFNNIGGQFISLENGAMNGTTTSIADQLFDGVRAGDMTDAQSFALEDKVRHEMDDSAVGLLMWKDNNLFATTSNRGIQAGIDIASNGWTVNVDSGTFRENLFISKDVDVIGRGSESTTLDGGSETAITEFGSHNNLIKGLTVTTDVFSGEGEGEGFGAENAILVDGRTFSKEEETSNGPINVSFNDIVIAGQQTESAIKFQNATLIGSGINDVVLDSSAPTGWKFENVTGGEPSDEFGEGDINFGNTFFADNYEIAAIELVNSTLDGDASNATFENDLENPFEREDRVIHDIDNTELGTIFYDGLDVVRAALVNSGATGVDISTFLASFTDINGVYYKDLSSIGRSNSNPTLGGAPTPGGYNVTNDITINLHNLNGGTGGLENLAPASGQESGIL